MKIILMNSTKCVANGIKWTKLWLFLLLLLLLAAEECVPSKAATLAITYVRCVPLLGLMRCTFSFNIGQIWIKTNRRGNRLEMKTTTTKNFLVRWRKRNEMITAALSDAQTFWYSLEPEICAIVLRLCVCVCVLDFCIWLQCMSSAHCIFTIFPFIFLLVLLLLLLFNRWVTLRVYGNSNKKTGLYICKQCIVNKRRICWDIKKTTVIPMITL